MGSGKSGGGSGIYNYYGTIAGALALGPVDEIYAIEIDDEIKWEGLVSRFNSPNPVALDIPGHGRPRLKPGTWDDITTRWRCTYSDRLKNFKERSVKYDDARARHAAGTKRPVTLRRDHITRHAQALSHLQETAHRNGTPGTSGTLNVRAALHATLLPGDHIRADIDPEPGGERLNQVFRVLEIIHRETRDEMQLRVEAERTLAPVPEFPSDDPCGPPAPPPAVPDIARARFFEAPAGLADNKNFRVGILASRPSDTRGVCPASMVTGYRVCYDKTPGDLFPRIGGTRSFAVYGKLGGAGLPSSDAGGGAMSFTVELTAQPGEEIIGENPGDTAARDDTLLAILIATDSAGRIKADAGDKAWIEILSCADFTATGQNLLEVTALRARQGTPPRAFPAGAEIWFIRRDQLTLIEHADFAQLAAANAPAWFKLQPLEPGGERPLEDCAPREFTFALSRDLPQLADARYLERRYRRMSLKPATPTGDIPANWSLADPGGSGVLWHTEACKREHTGKLLSP